MFVLCEQPACCSSLHKKINGSYATDNAQQEVLDELKIIDNVEVKSIRGVGVSSRVSPSNPALWFKVC